MVTATGDTEIGCRIFEVRPNCSLTREGRVLFFAAVSLLTLLVAVRFLLLGVWLVLPFALLEMVVLGVSLYLFERASHYSEIIQIAPDDIQIVARNGVKTLHEHHFPPYWVQVALQLDPRKWYPSKLFLRAHGQSVEIGACLTDADRKSLAETITTALETCRKTA